MKDCPACRTQLPDNAHFCGHCGRILDTMTETDEAEKTRRLLRVRVRSLADATATSVSDKIINGEPPANAQSLADTAVKADRASHAPTGTETEAAGVGPAPSVYTSNKVLARLPMPLQHIFAAVLARTRDAEPEVIDKSYQKATELLPITWGWLPLLMLTSALGILSVAYAYNISRNGTRGGDIFLWLGLLIIFVPAVVRLISPAASRFERLSLLCVIGICFYLVKVMFSPLYFSYFDEFLHWRTADDIVSSGHLFSSNGLLPVSPFYPGLEIVTDAFAKLSGLSTFISGTIVVGIARLSLIFALFMLYEFITKSARIAGIATVIYATNPHYLFFDAQFAYESLALPLALCMLFLMARSETAKSNRRWITFAAWLILGTVVVTHHVTDFFFDGLFILWVAIYLFRRPATLPRSSLACTALLAIVLSLAWINLPGNPVVAYLSPYFEGALSELGHVLAGTSSARPLFAAYSGPTTPLWQRVLALSSVGLIALCLPFGLLCLWQRYRSNALMLALGITSLLYPLSHLFRFTNFGSELPDRAAALLFIPIACVLAVFITQFWPTKHLSWKHITLITWAIVVLFLGGFILGSGPPKELLPGPYVVAADTASIEPEGIQAATWAHFYLGPNNRIATDRTNELLMGTFGDQYIVSPSDSKLDEEAIFFSATLGSYGVSVLQQAHVRYLVIDLRLSKALPQVGFYFDEGEPDAFQHTTPMSIEALTKFNTIPQVNRVFDSGDIVIYDVGGLINAPEKP